MDFSLLDQKPSLRYSGSDTKTNNDSTDILGLTDDTAWPQTYDKGPDFLSVPYLHDVLESLVSRGPLLVLPPDGRVRVILPSVWPYDPKQKLLQTLGSPVYGISDRDWSLFHSSLSKSGNPLRSKLCVHEVSIWMTSFL